MQAHDSVPDTNELTGLDIWTHVRLFESSQLEGSYWRRTCVLYSLSCVWLFATLWNVAHQVPLSMGFFRQGYWSGKPCSPPGDLPYPGIEPVSPGSADGVFTTEPLGKPFVCRGLAVLCSFDSWRHRIRDLKKLAQSHISVWSGMSVRISQTPGWPFPTKLLCGGKTLSWRW